MADVPTKAKHGRVEVDGQAGGEVHVEVTVRFYGSEISKTIWFSASDLDGEPHDDLAETLRRGFLDDVEVLIESVRFKGA